MLRLLKKHPSNEGIVSGEVFQSATPEPLLPHQFFYVSKTLTKSNSSKF